MGVLSRATRNEIAELVAGDPSWWPGFCGAIAEKGQVAITEERDLRRWSWGALWGWIVGNEERNAEYQRALEAYVQGLALGTVGIADGASAEEVAVAKLQVDTRFKLAGKVDRERWGDRTKAEGAAVLVVDAALVGFAGALLERLAGPKERVVATVPAASADDI